MARYADLQVGFSKQKDVSMDTWVHACAALCTIYISYFITDLIFKLVGLNMGCAWTEQDMLSVKYHK